MEILIPIAYLAMGIIFVSAICEPEEEVSGMMILLWPVLAFAIIIYSVSIAAYSVWLKIKEKLLGD